MNNKMKILLFVLVGLLIASFAGCGQVDVEATIDANNLVTYTYQLNFDDIVEGDINYNELDYYLFKMDERWKEYGFESTTIADENGIRMTSTMVKQCATRQEAFDTLYELMTNEVSPFVDVEYSYNQNYYYEDYTLTAHIDISGVIDDDIYEVYPQVVGQDIDSFMENLKFNVTLSLPYNDSTETDVVSIRDSVVEISHNAPTEISANGTINNNVNFRYERDLLAKKENEKKNLIIFSSIALVAIAGLVLLIVFRKKSQANRAEKEQSDKTDIIEETSTVNINGTDGET